MKSFVFLVLLFCCGTVCAEDAPRLIIDSYDSDLPAREFQRALPDATVREHKSDLIGRRERDELYDSIRGLAAHLQGFDELAKDQLYIRTTVLSLEALFRAYPEIPQEMLTELRNKVVATSIKGK